MQAKVDALKIAPRGRPPTRVARRVVQDLMDAAERALETKTAHEITTRDIAIAAGLNEAMIGYYFGGKTGLLGAMLDDMMRRTQTSIPQAMAAMCIASGSLRPLIEELSRNWFARPNLVRMIIIELLQDLSPIKTMFVDRYARSTRCTSTSCSARWRRPGSAPRESTGG